MQDKEFDQAFKTKFADFEVEPSAMVWDNIAHELDGKKAKRSLVPYLSIAASILILVAAGMLFFRPATDNTKHNTAVNNNRVAVNIPQSSTEKNEEVKPVAHTNSTINTVAVNKHTVPSISVLPVINATSTVNNTVNTKVNEQINATDAVNADNRQVLAAIEEPKHKELQLSSPGKETDLMPKSMNIDQPKAIDKPIIAAVKPAAPAEKKRGIHNMGGLINALIAKVDKRDEKIIHFTDDNDDDTGTVLTEVNLGVVKITKQ